MITSLRRHYFGYFFLLGTIMSHVVVAQDFMLSDITFEHNGATLAYPFAGGMSSPQFSEIDLNFDGVMDLFVFDRVGTAVSTYIYDTSFEDNYRFAPEYIPDFPSLNNWAFIRDFNDDGIPDIFTSDNIPTYFGVQVYKGSRSGNRLKFDLINLDQGPVNLLYFENENLDMVQMEVLPSDLPAVVDVDGDGDLDILDYDGSGGFVEFMRNMSIEKGYGKDSLIYKRADKCWGKFFEAGSSDATIVLSNSPDDCYSGVAGDLVEFRHVGSSITAFDFNSTGLYDALIGDVSNDNLNFLKNTGSKESAYMSTIDNDFPSSTTPIDLFTFPAAYIIDINHDGMKDIIAAPNEFLRTENINMNYLYLNEGTPTDNQFVKQSEDFLVRDMIDLSSATKPAVVDYNADGLWDLVIGTYGAFNDESIQFGQLYLYENIGTLTKPRYKLITDDYLNFRQFGEMNFYLTPTFGDLDGDGDSDLLIGNISGKLIYYENIAGAGNPFNFGQPQFNYQDLDIGNHANPAMADVDNDGLMDLIIGEENGNNNPEGTDKCSHYTFFRNIGSIGNPLFDKNLDSENNIACFGKVRLDDPLSDRKGYGSPQILEIDDELLLLSGSKFGEIKLYKNLRANMNDSFELVAEDLGHTNSGDRTHPILWDLNADGLLELIVGNLRGGIQIYDTEMTLQNLVTATEKVESLSFNISPNPAVDVINMTGEFSSQARYQINSMEGKLLDSGILNKSRNISVSQYPSGIYTVQVFDKRKSGIRKFIKF